MDEKYGFSRTDRGMKIFTHTESGHRLETTISEEIFAKSWPLVEWIKEIGGRPESFVEGLIMGTQDFRKMRDEGSLSDMMDRHFAEQERKKRE